MNKKNLVIIFIIIFIIFNIFFAFNHIYLKYKNKKFIEKTDVAFADDLRTSPFRINKIVLYSSRIWRKQKY